jgi:UDP-N-acetylmuramoyl-tripeptide--D-alanyl-D-alanine ligase
VTDSTNVREPMVLHAGEIAQATQGTLVAGSRDAVVDEFSIDTRTLSPGALFFAIRGDRFDGHRFVGDAVRAGASGVVVSEPVEIARDRIVISVADTKDGIKEL